MRSKRPGLKWTVASSRWLRWLRAIRQLRWVKNGPFERHRFRSVHLKADIRSMFFHFQKEPIVEMLVLRKTRPFDELVLAPFASAP